MTYPSPIAPQRKNSIAPQIREAEIIGFMML
jgi:hypothetical protein